MKYSLKSIRQLTEENEKDNRLSVISNRCNLFSNLYNHFQIKKITAVAIFVLSGIVIVQGQEADTLKKAKDKRPIASTFENGMLINNQTIINLKKRNLEMAIQHRFSTFEKGGEDKWGIFGPSNIRIGFDFGITERIQIGLGTTKNGSLEDGRWKIALLRQTRSGSMPLSVSYFGNVSYTSVKDKDKERFIKSADRVTYFHQLMIARKFSNRLSFQLSPSYMHFNIVDSSLGIKHDNLALSFSGRVNISPQSSITFEFDYPFTISKIEAGKAKPNLGIGLEVATTSHAFHIFVTTANSILNAQNIVYNQNDFMKLDKGLLLGFNITRLWEL